jgi:hypothetical protein
MKSISCTFGLCDMESSWETDSHRWGLQMSTVQIDHILTFSNVANIDEYIRRNQERGFVVSQDTFRYKPGLRNRFMSLGPEYIELVWVEDEPAFDARGTEEFARMFPNLPELRRAGRPFSIDFKTSDVETLHRNWAERGLQVPDLAGGTYSPHGRDNRD